MEIRRTTHPFKYVLKKYIQPLGLNQKDLQEQIHIGAKTLSELYNGKRKITAATALKLGKFFSISPEMLMMMQAEYDLAETCKKNRDVIDTIPVCQPKIKQEKVTDKADKKRSSEWQMLMATINNSVGDRSKHYTIKELEQLFFSQRFTARKQYLLMVLFREASAQDVIDFVKEKEIPLTQVNHLYDVYLNKFNGKRNPCFDWLFKEI